jgi:hypothetical protein
MRTLNDNPANKTNKTWACIFRELNQWNVVQTFAERRHGQALDTRAGFRRFCSRKIGHPLLAHQDRDFQIIHRVHQNGEDNINDNDAKGNIWELMGAGSTAATVVLSSTGTYNKQMGVT